MCRSNSCLPELALKRSGSEVGATNSPFDCIDTESARSLVIQDQRSRRFGGTWNSAGFVTVPQNLRDREAMQNAHS